MSQSNESNPSSLRDIYLRALDKKSPEARDAYLEGACGDNLSLRNKVDALLRENAEDSFLEAPAIENNDTLLDAPTETPGTVIGRYKILQPIGEGGFGTVYMAEQKEPVKRRVALKIIKLGMDTKQVVARFEAERQALAMMDHPNIAKVLDAGATDAGRPYFVMELVRGISITKYCDENNLSALERLNLFMDVCSAIQHAHQKGIIHRDIKPSNIMITLHDGEPVPKVIDFGIAKATQQELTEKTLFTQYSQFIGTPAYMSPEQAEMSGLDVDTRSDIYSLGVLLYELLTGRTPLDRESLMSGGYDEIRRRIREEEPSKPSTRVSTMIGEERTKVAKQRNVDAGKLSHLLRGDLDWVVMKALEKDRTRRYETANALRSDVQRFLNNEPVTAVKPSAAYLLGKYMRRHKTVVSFAATIALLLITATAISGSLAVKAKKAQMAQEDLTKEANDAKEDAIAAKEQADILNEQLKDQVYEALVEQANSIQLVGERGYRHQVWNLIGAAISSGSSQLNDVTLRNLAVKTIMDPSAYSLVQVTNSIPNPGQLSAVDIADRHYMMGYKDGSILIKDVLTAETLGKLETGAGAPIQSIARISSLNQWVAIDMQGHLYTWKWDPRSNRSEDARQVDIGDNEDADLLDFHNNDAAVFLVEAGSGFLLGRAENQELLYWNLASSDSPTQLRLKHPLEESPVTTQSYDFINHLQIHCNDTGTLAAIGLGSKNLIEILSLTDQGKGTVLLMPQNLSKRATIYPRFYPDGQLLACETFEDITVLEVGNWSTVFQTSDRNGDWLRPFLRFSPRNDLWIWNNAWDIQGNVIHNDMKSVEGYPIFDELGYEVKKAISHLRPASKTWVTFGADKDSPNARFEMASETSILGADFSSTNQLVAFSSMSGQVSLLDLKTGRERMLEKNAGLDQPEDPSFSPDGRLLTSTTKSPGEILVWDVVTGSLIHRESFGTDPRMAAFHPNDSRLFAIGDQKLMIWDYEYLIEAPNKPASFRLTLVREFPLRKENTAGCLRFSDDGQLVAWAEGNKYDFFWAKLALMRLNSFELIDIQDIYVEAHHGFEFLPHSHRMLLREENKTANQHHSSIFDPDHGTSTDLGEDFILNDYFTGGFRHSPVVGTFVEFRNNRLLYWQFDSSDYTPTLRFDVDFESELILSAAWSDDGTKLALSRSDGIAEVWDIPAMRRQLSELGLDW
jgi:serine/threonine protein kinase/WD40 repeat protein